MSDNFNPFSLNNEVFRMYVTYGVIVTFKMMSVSNMTSIARIWTKTFDNEEDFNPVWRTRKTSDEKIRQRIVRRSPVVDRLLRIHRNDLENIPAFMIIGLLYVATNPSPSAAMWHFRIFCLTRIFHFFAFMLPLPQQSRMIGFGLGFVTTLSMGIQVLRSAFQLAL